MTNLEMITASLEAKKMKPILFSTPMVQAILDGRKTQTRRVMKPANPFKSRVMGGYSQGSGLWIDGYKSGDEPNGHIKDYSVSSCWISKEAYIDRYAPYQPGDILWVRETWTYGKIGYGENEYGGDEPYISQCIGENDYIYREYAMSHNIGMDEVVWRPSIYMPREAARLFLRVTDVSVERVQEISEGDAIAEGVFFGEGQRRWTARSAFMDLWDSLNAKRGYGWDVNPWVYVYKFERCERPEDGNKGT